MISPSCDPPGVWDGPTIIATAIGGAGLVLSLIALGFQFRRRQLDKIRSGVRLRLAEKMKEGEELVQRLAALRETDGPWTEIETDIVTWRDETKQIISPEYQPLFESSAGLTFYGSAGEYSRLRNYMIGRLRRIAELIAQL